MVSRRTPRLLAAMLAALLLTLPTAAMAKTAQDIYHLSEEFQQLDAIKESIGKLHKQVNGDLENSQTSPALFVLHDLEYFSQMARLELHNLVEVFVLTDLPAEQARFRKDKDEELRRKLHNVHIDLERRLAYVRLIEPPDVPEDMTGKIVGYAESLKSSLKQSLGLLKSVEQKMDE